MFIDDEGIIRPLLDNYIDCVHSFATINIDIFEILY